MNNSFTYYGYHITSSTDYHHHHYHHRKHDQKYYIYSAMLLSDERVEDGLEIKFDHKVYFILSSLDSVNTSESVFLHVTLSFFIMLISY